MSAKNPRVLIAAGGTGGHIFPALHVARALKEVDSTTDLAFIGAGRPLEEKLIDAKGYKRYVVPAARVMQEGPLGIVRFIFTFPDVMWRVWHVFRDFKPDVVVGMGGYVSVLPVILARLLGIPTWIHEAELSPGLANKVLGLVSSKVSVAFAKTRMLTNRPLEVTGHPVRAELAGIAEMQRPETPKNLLVVGGSQGARAIDEAMAELAPKLATLGLTIRHQTRKENCDKIKDAYTKSTLSAEVTPFIDDMPEAYRWADLIVSRAGAGALSELGVVNRPAILVPYPHAQGGHQRGNAMVLVDAGKALLVEEGADFQSRLLNALKDLSQPDRYANMRKTASDTRALGAAKSIATGILAFVRK